MPSRRSFCFLTVGLTPWAWAGRPAPITNRIAFIDVDTDGGRTAFRRYVEACRRIEPELGRNAVFTFDPIDLDSLGYEARLDAMIRELANHAVRIAVATSSVVAHRFAQSGPPMDTLFHSVESRAVAASPPNALIGNPRMTGFLSNIFLGAKRIELLDDAGVKPRCIGLPVDAYLDLETDESTRMQDVARRRGIRLLMFNANTLPELERNIDQTRGVVDAYVIPRLILTVREAHALCAAVNRSSKPAIYAQSRMVEAGGLLSYEASIGDAIDVFARQTAAILAGVRVEDLPVEYPRHYQLAVNLETAERLGIRMPAKVIRQAGLIVPARAEQRRIAPS